MSAAFEDLKQAAMELSRDQKLDLAGLLLHSANEEYFNQIDAAWNSEIQRRIADLDEALARGEEGGELVEDVLAELRSEYKG
jgi:hypothetical protein